MRKSYRSAVQNIVPIVTNTALCTSKFSKRVDLLLSILNRNTEGENKHLEEMDMFSALIVLIDSWLYKV